MKLVGLPAPSHLAQRDVAKTISSAQTAAQLVAPSKLRKSSWRRAKCGPTFTWLACRFEGVPNAASAAKPVYLIGGIFSTFLTGDILHNHRVYSCLWEFGRPERCPFATTKKVSFRFTLNW
jgi:hypothetical protein